MKERKKLASMGIAVHQQMMAMFGEEFESSPSMSSIISDSDEVQTQGPFKEIEKLKKTVEFSPDYNLVKQPPEEVKEDFKRLKTRGMTQFSRREELIKEALQKSLMEAPRGEEREHVTDSPRSSVEPHSPGGHLE